MNTKERIKEYALYTINSVEKITFLHEISKETKKLLLKEKFKYEKNNLCWVKTKFESKYIEY